MKTSKQSNRDIAIRHLWEHVQFGWRFPERMCNRAVAYPSYRALVVGLTASSLEMMRFPLERDALKRLLLERHGPSLIPSETELKFPEGSPEDMESWMPAFEALTNLYGSLPGTRRRTARKPQFLISGVRLDELSGSFQQVTNSSFEGTVGTLSRIVVEMQEFPRDYLYRLTAPDGGSCDFDDWPSKWDRAWRNEDGPV